MSTNTHTGWSPPLYNSPSDKGGHSPDVEDLKPSKRRALSVGASSLGLRPTVLRAVKATGTGRETGGPSQQPSQGRSPRRGEELEGTRTLFWRGRPGAIVMSCAA